MQASLEAESRGKTEAMRVKKKLEQDINELEVALDSANRGRADADKNIKRFQVIRIFNKTKSHLWSIYIHFINTLTHVFKYVVDYH